MSISGRLTKVYKDSERIYFHRGDCFVMMSDCHRGTGNAGDDFLKNRHIYLAALRYYNRLKYNYVELGDGEELWENKEPEAILKVYGEIYELMEQFHRENRLYLLYGNHDIKKKKENYYAKKSTGFCCEASGRRTSFFKGLSVREGLILEECGTGRNIFLVHGHQGDVFNDTFWRVNCFLVRHIWRRMELLGMENPMSTSGNGKKKTKVERKLMEWAKDNRQIMVAGHTHRLKYPSGGEEEYYFNDGSCVRPYSVTAIELENGVLRPVEWSIMTKTDQSMYVGRTVLAEISMERLGN